MARHRIWAAIRPPAERPEWPMHTFGPPAEFQHYCYCSCGWWGGLHSSQTEALREAQEHVGGDAADARPPRDGGA